MFNNFGRLIEHIEKLQCAEWKQQQEEAEEFRATETAGGYRGERASCPVRMMNRGPILVATNPASDGRTQASQAGKRPASVSFTQGRRFGRIEDHFGGTVAPRACPE